MSQLYLTSLENDFLKNPHKIKSYELIKIERKTCLRCKMDDKITVWINNRLHVFEDVLLIDRVWFRNRLKKMKKFPVEVHIIDYNTLENGSLKNAFNIAWGILKID